jgi:hypothetical protein
VRESIVTKPLYTPTFVVNANQCIATYCFDIRTQLRELGATLPIATKQNYPASHWMAQALSVQRCQLCACNIQY